MSSTYQKAYRKLRKQCQKQFPRYKEINNFLKILCIMHPRNVRLEVLGHSLEGRPIWMIILQDDQKCPKNAVMIEGGIHAREWLSHTTVLYVVDHVLRSKTLLRYMDFYVIPCINPDGYEFTHQYIRLWRKNMNRNKSLDYCNWGVDLNRNFPTAFGERGSSRSRDSNKYCGARALSEPESRCLVRAMHLYANYIKLYLAIHCYGHLIMYPWSYTIKPCPDCKVLVRHVFDSPPQTNVVSICKHKCATQAQIAMKKKFPKSKFRVGQVSKVMYISSGTSTDYVRDHFDVKFSYTMELHKAGKSGFVAKPNRILPVARETLAGIQSMVKFVSRYYCNSSRYL